MISCQDCVNQTCLKEGKPCQEIENLLKKQGIYSREWIRPKISAHIRDSGNQFREIPFSALPDKDGSNLKTE
jgi:hypothetical protein